MKKRIAKWLVTVAAFIGAAIVLHYAKDIGIGLMQRIGLEGVVGVLEDMFDMLDCIDMLVLIRHVRKHEKQVRDKI